MPCVAAIGGFVQAPARHIRRCIHRPWWPPCRPERGIDCLRSVQVDCEIDSAHIVRIFRVDQNLLPMCSAVERTINATVRIRLVDVPESRDVNAIWVGWIDDDFSNLARLSEPDGVPRLARVD